MTDPLSRTHIIALDAADPLRPLRNDFLIPRSASATPGISSPVGS